MKTPFRPLPWGAGITAAGLAKVPGGSPTAESLGLIPAPLRLLDSGKHNRTLVAEIDGKDALEIEIRYTAPSSGYYGSQLDGKVIPAIRQAVNGRPALRAALKALRDAAMNTPALDSSPEWTALIQQADAALQP